MWVKNELLVIRILVYFNLSLLDVLIKHQRKFNFPYLFSTLKYSYQVNILFIFFSWQSSSTSFIIFRVRAKALFHLAQCICSVNDVIKSMVKKLLTTPITNGSMNNCSPTDISLTISKCWLFCIFLQCFPLNFQKFFINSLED